MNNAIHEIQVEKLKKDRKRFELILDVFHVVNMHELNSISENSISKYKNSAFTFREIKRELDYSYKLLCEGKCLMAVSLLRNAFEDFSNRTYNRLKRYKINTYNDLLNMSIDGFSKVPGVGVTVLSEVQDRINQIRNSLKNETSNEENQKGESRDEEVVTLPSNIETIIVIREKAKKLILNHINDIHALLKKENITISEKVVRKLMKEENLIVIQRKTSKRFNSYQGEITPAVENLVKRDFHSKQKNQLWLTDISEFAIPAGKAYLSPIVDCFDGYLPSWTIGTSPNAELANTMLDKAYLTLTEKEHPIVHSDRGAHYRWPEWIRRMKEYGLIRSMSKKGCSPDNSACEGLFGRIKNEFFYGRNWNGVSMEEFIKQLNNYLIWYNEKRIKKSLGYLSPMEYRKLMCGNV